MAETIQYKIPYPTESDIADVPTDMKKMAEKIDEELGKIKNGTGGTTGVDGKSAYEIAIEKRI